MYVTTKDTVTMVVIIGSMSCVQSLRSNVGMGSSSQDFTDDYLKFPGSVGYCERKQTPLSDFNLNIHLTELLLCILNDADPFRLSTKLNTSLNKCEYDNY